MEKPKRCPKGSRRNPKTKRCNKIKKTNIGKKPSFDNANLGIIEDNTRAPHRRFPNGTRKNPKTGECEPIIKNVDSKKRLTIPTLKLTPTSSVKV